VDAYECGVLDGLASAEAYEFVHLLCGKGIIYGFIPTISPFLRGIVSDYAAVGVENYIRFVEFIGQEIISKYLNDDVTRIVKMYLICHDKTMEKRSKHNSNIETIEIEIDEV